MAVLKSDEKEKLFVGLLYHEREYLDTAEDLLVKTFGEYDYKSQTFLFSAHSRYYDDEMGGDVYRVFYSFSQCVKPYMLGQIKLDTISIEDAYRRQNKRVFNIDPGLINPGRLALATTKNASHRIALNEKIFAEITLFYSRGKWNVMPWTYIDFQTKEVHDILTDVRNIYMAQRKAELKNIVK